MTDDSLYACLPFCLVAPIPKYFALTPILPPSSCKVPLHLPCLELSCSPRTISGAFLSLQMLDSCCSCTASTLEEFENFYSNLWSGVSAKQLTHHDPWHCPKPETTAGMRCIWNSVPHMYTSNTHVKKRKKGKKKKNQHTLQVVKALQSLLSKAAAAAPASASTNQASTRPAPSQSVQHSLFHQRCNWAPTASTLHLTDSDIHVAQPMVPHSKATQSLAKSADRYSCCDHLMA